MVQSSLVRKMKTMESGMRQGEMEIAVGMKIER
jgi:hypothetical protein